MIHVQLRLFCYKNFPLKIGNFYAPSDINDIPSCPLTTTISVCSHALWLPSEVLSLCILLILWMDHAQLFSLKPLWCLYPHHSLLCHHFHCTYDHQLWVSSMITNSGGSFLPLLYLPWKGFLALWPSSPSWQLSNGGIPLSPALGVLSLVLQCLHPCGA